MMKKFLLIASFFVATLAVVFFCVHLQEPAQAQTGASKQLFRLSESAHDAASLSIQERVSIATVRQSAIEVQLAAKDLVAVEELAVPMFDGKLYQVVRQKKEGLEVRSTNDATFRGSIKGIKGSSATITIKNGVLSGLIIAGSEVYEIAPEGSTHVLAQIDQSQFPECGGEVHDLLPSDVEQTLLSNSSEQQAVAADPNDQIDVLVVYTPAVRNNLGDSTRAESFAQQAVDVTNTAYQNSRVNQRLRLVGAVEVSYSEGTSLSDDLNWVRQNSQVADLRNQYKADLVALIVNDGKGLCGIASLMTTVSSSFASRAFSVTARSCAVSNLTFAHELGHNMGSAHDPENGSGGAYSYSYGHYLNGQFRDVMAYSNACSSGCPKIPYFSNPDVSYKGIPTGLSTRNNALSLNNTASTVANFRQSGSAPTPTPTPGPTPRPTPTPTPTSTPGPTPTPTPKPPIGTVIVDNTDPGFSVTGSWETSTKHLGYYGNNYLHDGSGGSNRTDTARWAAPSASGTYRVFMRWSASSTRPDAAPVEVTHNGGVARLTVNQRTRGGEWVELGTWSFGASGSGQQVLLRASDSGYTVADAVQFVKVE